MRISGKFGILEDNMVSIESKIPLVYKISGYHDLDMIYFYDMKRMSNNIY